MSPRSTPAWPSVPPTPNGSRPWRCCSAGLPTVGWPWPSSRNESAPPTRRGPGPSYAISRPICPPPSSSRHGRAWSWTGACCASCCAFVAPAGLAYWLLSLRQTAPLRAWRRNARPWQQLLAGAIAVGAGVALQLGRIWPVVPVVSHLAGAVLVSAGVIVALPAISGRLHRTWVIVRRVFPLRGSPHPLAGIPGPAQPHLPPPHQEIGPGPSPRWPAGGPPARQRV